MEQQEKKQILIKSITRSVNDFFSSMCPMEVKSGEVIYDDRQVQKSGNYELLSVIAITGMLKGSIGIALHKNFSKTLAQTLLGMDSVTDGDIFDTAGEFCNIVAGGSKTHSANFGLDYNITCPTVVSAEVSAEIEPMRGSKIINLPFSASAHEFLVVASLVDS